MQFVNCIHFGTYRPQCIAVFILHCHKVSALTPGPDLRGNDWGDRPRASRNIIHRFYLDICSSIITNNSFLFVVIIRNKKNKNNCYVVNLKSTVFWDAAPSSPLSATGRFGGTHLLRLQARRISRERNQRESRLSAEMLSRWFPARLIL
jgi:hypothetical protein